MKLKENPIVYLWLKVWRYSENSRKVVLYVLMSLMANLIHLCIPLIFALLATELQKNGVTDSNFWYLIFLSSLFLVRCVLGWLFHGPSRTLEERNAFRNRAFYKTFLLGGVLGLQLKWHAEHHSGDTFDKVEKGSNGLFDFSENTFRVVGILSSMVVSFFALLFFDRASSFIALAMMIVTISIIVVFDKKLALQYRALNRMENKVSEKIMDVIENVNTVVILRIEKLLLESIRKKVLEPYQLFCKNNLLNEIKWFLVSLCTNIMVFGVLAYYIHRVYWGLPLVFGTFVALYGYTKSVEEQFYEFASFYGNMLKWKARVQNAEELALEFKQIPDETNGNQNFNWQELRVENLNFSYHSEDGADLHLENVCFEAKRGEKIAVIGATGSGKTTLLQILPEWYKPQSGRIFLDDKELRDGFGAIKSQIALVPQNSDIFAASIFENITAWEEYDMEMVRKYSDLACFTGVAEKLPKKWQSVINERGVNLSGGERQRLALARGLLFACEDKLEPKSIVLLDEPTSSVDVATEIEIHKNVFDALSNKTIVESVHRLHLLPMFDRIYFFENGKVIISGTFGELLQNSKEFQEMWSKYNFAFSKAAE